MIDPVTILGISSLSALLALVIMGSLARGGIPGTREWGWANVALVCGILLLVSHAALPPWLSVIAGNATIGGAAILQLIGLQRFFRRHPAYRLCAVPFVAMVGLIAYFQYGRDSMAARVVVFSLYHAGFSLALGTLVVLHRPRDRPAYAYVFMLGVAYAATVLHLTRAMAYLSGSVAAHGAFTATPLHVVFLAIGTMAAPALTIGMVMMTHDRMSAALERHANIDYLTDLLGRRAFTQAADRECQRARQFGRPLSLAILDIDFFKQINDRFGHAGGDDMLVHFAAQMRDTLRDCDIGARIGGEEFAWLLPKTRAAATQRVLAQFRTRMAETHGMIGNRPVPCTFSAGIAEFAAGDSLDALMARADAALYQAKHAGRDRTVIGPRPPEHQRVSLGADRAPRPAAWAPHTESSFAATAEHPHASGDAALAERRVEHRP
ncbi:GGDEF domain-containing protein [Robbsia sp. Bb-Pol-6]|uniref:diguanylate cyclase n=1 Tax=Robbsia betulipollinis TaxID=2981849 RepID=A0ABT3ZPK6_9BURK|nr:GGDEF domain-containing protein [Robbsia betulipollinis]MCY0388484.1 GGDEF domain-containing protein [Robbsia betulipollinis]